MRYRPVQDEPVGDVNPIQVSGIVLWDAEKVQVVALLLITELRFKDVDSLKVMRSQGKACSKC